MHVNALSVYSHSMAYEAHGLFNVDFASSVNVIEVALIDSVVDEANDEGSRDAGVQVWRNIATHFLPFEQV